MAIDLHIKPGNVVEVLTKKEMWPILSRWLEIYGRNYDNPGNEQYYWHVFSSKSYDCFEQDEANSLYCEQSESEYYLMPNDFETVYVVDQRPESVDALDYYVFPKDFAWTYVMTHEKGWLGPYFAYHYDYDKLMEKRKEIAVAQKNGWM